MDAIQRLEKWKYGHKSRSGQIEIDDGYGATCWRVELRGNGKEVFAAETNFFTGKAKENVVFVVDGDSKEDWPGLSATIHAALDKAEEMGL
jgi:hypothetical protein